MPDRLVIQQTDRDRDQVVAADHAGLGQPLRRTNLHLRTDPTHGPGDRRTRDGAQHGDRSIAGQYADRAATSRGAEVRPDDVSASYHSGAVSAASRAADATTAGSWGTRR